MKVPDSEFIGPNPDAPSYGDLLSRVAVLEAALRQIEQMAESPSWDDPSAGVGPVARAVLSDSNGCYRP